MKICEYCELDKDECVKPFDKHAHAYLYPTMGEWRLIFKYATYKKSLAINYCPMCGRKLKEVKE